jgi:hypothetical protein
MGILWGKIWPVFFNGFGYSEFPGRCLHGIMAALVALIVTASVNARCRSLLVVFHVGISASQSGRSKPHGGQRTTIVWL